MPATSKPCDAPLVLVIVDPLLADHTPLTHWDALVGRGGDGADEGHNTQMPYGAAPQ